MTSFLPPLLLPILSQGRGPLWPLSEGISGSKFLTGCHLEVHKSLAKASLSESVLSQDLTLMTHDIPHWKNKFQVSFEGMLARQELVAYANTLDTAVGCSSLSLLFSLL